MNPHAPLVQSDTLGVAVKGVGAATAVVFISDALNLALPFLILAFVVILVDLYFGIRAAQCRGEAVRASRALRRTAGKVAEYLCWTILASTLAVTFDYPALTKWVVGFVIGVEGLSIVQNWLALHGKRITGIEEFAKEIIKDKTGHDASMIHVENAPQEPKNNKQSKQ